MLTYGNSKTFTWEHGRELSGMTDASGNWSFTYNVDGLRVYRSNGTATYKYYYSGDKLTRMVVNGEDITFGYDANGAPQYVIYGGHRYFYLTNLQGDVTAIITVGGTTVVEYTYDAWGNILTVTGGMANTLGKANPLRYRGYVYDEETRLYYLQSRYYDPQIGRFINADVFVSTGQGLLGNNMFAYCLNNPVNNVDPSGNVALVDDIIVLSLAAVVILPLIVLITVPPIPVVEAVATEFSHFVNKTTETIKYGANILLAKTKGKERVRDTGLAEESDEEIRRKAHDKSLPKSEQRRYQTEEKARGLRNRSKRLELYK